MEIIADILLVSGALGASFYCFILGRKLTRFNSLEKGVGGAVAVLSAQVDDLEKTLTSAQLTAQNSAKTLTDLTERANETSRTLELQMASLHDVPHHEALPPLESEQKPSQKSEPMFVRHVKNGVKT